MTFDLYCAKAIIENNTHLSVDVRKTWIDYGANWSEYTLVSTYPEEYQLLSPRDVKEAKAGTLSIEAMQKIIDEINHRGW